MAGSVARICNVCLIALFFFGCLSGVAAQLSPDESALRALAEAVFDIEEANTLLPAGTYDAQIAASQNIKAPECPELSGAQLDLRIARMGRDTTESMQLQSGARTIGHISREVY
jgi:hypothetical protein